MSRAVFFTRIDVRRMPGFPRGGLAIDNLAPGINVIYGPNASGKTTLGRAMRRLLQIHSADRQADSLTGEVSIEGERFEIDYDLGQITCRRSGREVPPPTLAPAEVDQQYVLALHDLVQNEDDRDIVAQILQEAAGGYDIASAARSLGFDRERPRSRNNKTVRDYDDRVRKRKNAEQRLLEVERAAEELAELKRRRAEAHRARHRQTLIEHALAVLAKQESLAQATQYLAGFAEAMSKLTGDEWKRLEEIKNSLAKRRSELAAAQASLQKAKTAIETVGLPSGGVPAATVETLQTLCESLWQRAQRIGQLETELRGATKQLEKALAVLGPDVAPDQAEALDPKTLDKLFTFVRKAEDFQLEAKAHERLARWLDVVPSNQSNVGALEEGIVLLRQWLAEQRITMPARGGTLPWMIAAGLAAVAAGAMALVHLSWLLLLLPAAGLALWPLVRPHLIAAPSPGPPIPEQWTGLRLPPPNDWNVAGVQSRLRNLQQELAAAQLAQERSQRFADLQESRQAYERQRQQIETAYAQWRERLGIHGDIHDARLYRLAATIFQIQEAQGRVSDVTAQRTEAGKQHAALLDRINNELAAHVDTRAADAEEATALVRNLDRRCQEYRSAVAQRDNAQAEIDRCSQHIAELEMQRDALFGNLGLTPDDEVTLRGWLDQLEEYRKAQEDVRMAAHDCDTAVSKLAGHEKLLQEPRESLEREWDTCQQLAESLEELDQRLGDIRGRIRDAKQATALEAALAEEEACLDELRSLRDDDAAELVGGVLVAYLARQQREVRQPGVLKRAEELFARITHGRYRLLVEPGDPPSFRALDTSLGREQNLDELSSGTRLQLLLSVRVAFVEQQEQETKLPLIFDETLGNSDEQRSQKIIEAAVELARSGRQVFYFTAQHDELAKWRRALRQTADVESREFDLARLRGFSETEFAPEVLDFDPPVSAPIPAPEQDDWITYGRKLSVPLLDQRSHIGDVHLWYLIDDVDTLYRLLSHDINRWGQLQTLVDFGSAEGLTRDAPVYSRAAASARLLENLLGLWRQGRGKPVDRTVLEASHAVSDAFIDRVAELARSHGGDARRLIEDLRDGRVARFRTERIEALETHLLEHGYLDERPVLDEEAIRDQIRPLVLADCEAGLLSRERVDQLVALVTRENTPKDP